MKAKNVVYWKCLRISASLIFIKVKKGSKPSCRYWSTFTTRKIIISFIWLNLKCRKSVDFIYMNKLHPSTKKFKSLFFGLPIIILPDLLTTTYLYFLTGWLLILLSWLVLCGLFQKWSGRFMRPRRCVTRPWCPGSSWPTRSVTQLSPTAAPSWRSSVSYLRPHLVPLAALWRYQNT